MNPQNSNDQDAELQRREKEVQEREMAIRLREMEAELHQQPIPLHKTVKHQEPKGSFQKWTGKLATLGKFVAIVVTVVVAVRIASWLATVLIIGGIAWVAYKILFENERNNS